ncbi:MAG: hypothetical protein IPO63_10350 [Bacteroidetes bacterium]|nr:hypothetical protein [Bacteroidota bacterium]
MTDEEIINWAAKFNVAGPEYYKIDTLSYMKAARSTKNRDSSLAKHITQPLQMRLFNSSRESYISLANCDFPSIFKLDWNHFKSFDTFPPDMKDFGKYDTTFNLDIELEKIVPIGKEGKSIDKKSDIFIIIYWSRITSRYSRDLIKVMNDYKDKYKNESLEIIFVNTDNLFVN